MDIASFNPTEWSIIHFYIEHNFLDQITGEVIPFVRNLEGNDKIKNFFYFRYTVPEVHLKIVVWRKGINHGQLVEYFQSFTLSTPIRKDTHYEQVVQTGSIEGLPDFLLSSTGRKLSDLLKQELGQNLTQFQIFFMLHYFFNNIGFSNLDEAKVASYHLNDWFQKQQ